MTPTSYGSPSVHVSAPDIEADDLPPGTCAGVFVGVRELEGREFSGPDEMFSYGCAVLFESESGLGIDVRITTSERFSNASDDGLTALQSNEFSLGAFQTFGEFGLRPFVGGGFSILGMKEYVTNDFDEEEVIDRDLFFGGYSEAGLILGDRGTGTMAALAWRHYVGGEEYDQVTIGIGISF